MQISIRCTQCSLFIVHCAESLLSKYILYLLSLHWLLFPSLWCWWGWSGWPLGGCCDCWRSDSFRIWDFVSQFHVVHDGKEILDGESEVLFWHASESSLWHFLLHLVGRLQVVEGFQVTPNARRGHSFHVCWRTLQATRSDHSAVFWEILK